MKRRNILIIITILLVSLLLGVTCIIFFRYSNDKVKNNENVNVEVIANYNYILEDRDPKIYKENFQLLKEEIEKENIDYENYAKLLSKLYIIDLYTISNKINQYDVGGSDFVHVDARENYELKVKDTLYKYVEDNSYGIREQVLPTVSSVEIVGIEEDNFEILDRKLEGYSVKLSWTYDKELGYDTNAVVNIVKESDKLYIISQSVLEK